MVFVSPSWVPSIAGEPIPDTVPVSQFVLDEQYGRCRLAESRPPFICISGKQYSSAEMRQRVDNLSRAFAKEFSWSPNEGSEWDKVVAIYALNAIDALSVSWAVHRLSGVSSPANAAYTVSELSHQLESSKARAIFTCPPLLDNALAAAERCRIPPSRIYLLSMSQEYVSNRQSRKGKCFKTVDQLVDLGATLPEIEPLKWQPGQGARQCAFLMYSSGTTGLPKGVMVSHRNVIANILQLCTFEASSRNHETRHVNLGLLPQSHIYGLVAICHVSVYRGESVVVLPKFNLRILGKAIERFRIDVLYVAPPVVLSMVSQSQILDEFDLTSVTEVFSGAAPLSAQLAWTLLLLYPGWKVRQAYGLTETATVVAATSPEDILLGSCGSLLPGVEAKLICSENGLEIHEHNKPGELYVRSPSVTTMGYLDNPQTSAETFTDDGWLRTGDEAMIVTNTHSSGKLTEHLIIVDRIKELIKVKGYQVAPAELEECLLTHPWVVDAAVIPVPDAASGELPKAFIVVKELGSSNDAQHVKEDIDRYVRRQKASYKWLRGGIDIVNTIPRNSSGKILRRLLKDKESMKLVMAARL